MLHGARNPISRDLVRMAAFAVLVFLFHAWWTSPTRWDQEQLDTQVRRLRTGESREILLYDTQWGTDRLLKQLSGMAEVESLVLDLTNVSDAGMRHVATLPNLKRLVIEGGNPGVGNRGLSFLTGCPVEKLELINTKVDDEGLAHLQSLPNLRALTVYCDARRGRGLTDAGLDRLAGLSALDKLHLDRLHISGSWASEAGLARIRTRLRNCTITTDANSHGASKD